MDLRHTASTIIDESFPRTRGDGPSYLEHQARADMFPPHARGWTRFEGHLRFQILVSPARAGMDLVELRPVALSVCFPRTRGDGP